MQTLLLTNINLPSMIPAMNNKVSAKSTFEIQSEPISAVSFELETYFITPLVIIACKVRLIITEQADCQKIKLLLSVQKVKFSSV